jgi:3-hydroxy-9,10-secoandrosta-1,3,5(10)-triene-9,17-dione monooxygenase reductase component
VPLPPADAPVHDPLLPEERGVDGECLREVMRRVASPVTVVTTGVDGERRGATIGSFTSVSLHPPLISFNVMRGTGFHDVLRRATHFAVHLLRDDQAEAAEHFARPDLSEADLFEGVPLRRGTLPGGVPLLRDALGILHCRVWEVVPAGDHDLFLGEVLRLDGAPVDGGHSPLLYYARSYRAVGREV